jgi:hypothetical protein
MVAAQRSRTSPVERTHRHEVRHPGTGCGMQGNADTYDV